MSKVGERGSRANVRVWVVAFLWSNVWAVTASIARDDVFSVENAVGRAQYYARTMRSAGIDLEALCRTA